MSNISVEPRNLRSNKDQRLSNCNFCKKGIFPNQKREFMTGGVIGLVHSDCKHKWYVKNGLAVDTGKVDDTGIAA